jgi:YVTN family beta-propeller protein
MGCFTVLLAAASALTPVVAAAPLYKISQTVKLGGSERWDYLYADPLTHRVYVSHGDQVTVVDGSSGKLIGSVGSFPGGTHGIAIDDASSRGYTDDGKAGKAEVFDLKSLKTLGSIDAQDDADGIAYDPKTRHVFVVDGDAGKITVIDAAANKAIATIDVGGKLEFAGVNGSGKLFVNGNERNELVRIDIATNQVEERWNFTKCQKPSGLAVDWAHDRVFSSCRNGVMEIKNGETGATVAVLPIGAGTDAAKFDAVRQRAFSSNGRDGTVTVIHEDGPDQFRVEGTVTTEKNARTMAVDDSTGRLYLTTADTVGGPPAAPSPGQPPKRPMMVAGSARLLILDPVN